MKAMLRLVAMMALVTLLFAGCKKAQEAPADGEKGDTPKAAAGAPAVATLPAVKNVAASASAMTDEFSHLVPAGADFVFYLDLAALFKGMDDIKLLQRFDKRPSDLLLLLAEFTPLKRFDVADLRDLWFAASMENEEAVVVVRFNGSIGLGDVFDNDKTQEASHSGTRYLEVAMGGPGVLQLAEVAPQVIVMTPWQKYDMQFDQEKGEFTQTPRNEPAAIAAILDRQVAGKKAALDATLAEGLKQVDGQTLCVVLSGQGAAQLGAMAGEGEGPTPVAGAFGGSLGSTVSFRAMAWFADDAAATTALGEVNSKLAESIQEIETSAAKPGQEALTAKTIAMVKGIKAERDGKLVKVGADWSAAAIGELLDAVPQEFKDQLKQQMGGAPQ